jgi:predicted protein tyrosine phosphatase
MRRYLFICGGGLKRSPTAASVAREIAKEKGIDIIADSGAIDVSIGSMSDATRERFKQYDKVVVMEPYMVEKFEKSFSVGRSRMHCLNIPNNYITDEQLANLRLVLRPKLWDIIG